MLVDLTKDKKLTLYKSILNNFWEYYMQFPMTTTDTRLDRLTEVGKKCIPVDERAQDILIHIMSTWDKPAACVQHLLNDTFDSLPTPLKPITVGEKSDGTFVTAKWYYGDKESDKIWSLINLDGEKKCYWSLEGKKVNLITE